MDAEPQKIKGITLGERVAALFSVVTRIEDGLFAPKPTGDLDGPELNTIGRLDNQLLELKERLEAVEVEINKL